MHHRPLGFCGASISCFLMNNYREIIVYISHSVMYMLDFFFLANVMYMLDDFSIYCVLFCFFFEEKASAVV